MPSGEVARYLVVSAIVLLAFWSWGLWLSAQAPVWCRRQKELVKRYSEDWPGDQEAEPTQELPAAGAGASRDGPDPVRERLAILSRMRGTALMQGDIGSFVLRRQDVPGEHAAGHHATLLVSLALAFTVFGLICTLRGLHQALGVPDAAIPGEPLEVLMAQVQVPLSHLPWLFVPTLLGLGLAVHCTWLQARVEAEVDETWRQIDYLTETVLVPRSMGADGTGPDPAGAIEQAAQAINQAAGDFVRSVRSLEATLDRARSVLEGLARLDLSRWASDLVQASAVFQEAVQTSAGALTKSSNDFRVAVEPLPNAADEFADSAQKLSGAVGQLAPVGSEIRDAVKTLTSTVERAVEAQGEVVQLRENIGALADAMNRLLAAFLSWSEAQVGQINLIRQMVQELRDAVAPLLQAWKKVSDEIAGNAEATRRGLERVQQELAGTCEQLRAILEMQQAAFGQVAAQIADSMREGFQNFVIWAHERFDQEEGLYEHLAKLREGLSEHQTALDRHGEALKSFSAESRKLPDAVQGFREDVSGLRAVVDDLKTEVKGLAGSLQQRDAELLRRLEGTIKQELQELRQTFSGLGDLGPAARSLGIAVDKLGGALGPVSALLPAVGDLKEAVEALRRTLYRGFWDYRRSPALRWLGDLLRRWRR